MLKLISNVLRGRGENAPALFACSKALLGRLVRASRGYALMVVGVVGAAVVVVTLLTFLAPDSDRPLIGRPVGAVQSILPGVLEQVEDRVGQTATLLGVDEESIQNVGENMSAGLTAARSGISNVWAPTPGIVPAAGTAPATPASEQSSSSPATDESSPPQPASEPSAPSSSSTDEASAPDGPPTTEAPPPTMTSEPTPPSVTEEPSPPSLPPAEEEPPAPPKDDSPLPPVAEEPPAPPKDEPALPTTAEEPPPPVTKQPEA